MQIKEFYKLGKTVLSMEVFPPKKDAGLETVYSALDTLSGLHPDFISVTYGAGGENGSNVTMEISDRINSVNRTVALSHLTCAGLGEHNIVSIAEEFKKRRLENILALRGDLISDGGFRYAKDLISALKKYGFCIGAAAYPEGHIACDDINNDIRYLKEKEDAGADFFITQLFFSNDLFYRFLDRARNKGVTAPISAGIMPIMSHAQISRMIFLCGASLPSPIIKMINRYGNEGDDLIKAGLEYSLKQMQDLADNGADGIHIYTMNKPFIAEYCVNNLKINRV